MVVEFLLTVIEEKQKKNHKLNLFNVRNPRNQLFSVKLGVDIGFGKVIKQKDKNTGVAVRVGTTGNKKYLRSAKKLCSQSSFNKGRYRKGDEEYRDKEILSLYELLNGYNKKNP